MKNREQTNNINNLNDPTVANDPQTLVEDLPISDEQEEQVKGGFVSPDLMIACADGKHIAPESSDRLKVAR